MLAHPPALRTSPSLLMWYTATLVLHRIHVRYPLCIALEHQDLAVFLGRFELLHVPGGNGTKTLYDALHRPRARRIVPEQLHDLMRLLV